MKCEVGYRISEVCVRHIEQGEISPDFGSWWCNVEPWFGLNHKKPQ